MTDGVRATVVFDLDGVLTTRDTFATLVRRRLSRSPWRLVLALPALPVMAVTGSHPRLRGAVARYLVRVALLGERPEAARERTRELAREFARNPAWLCGPGVRAARGHLDAGDRVVVVTATERELARTLLDEVGLGAADVLASELSPALGGSRMAPHNYGPRKLETMEARGLPRPWAVMYTDSWADEAVAGAVDRVVLVNPSAKLVRRAHRSWPGRVDVIGSSGARGC